MTFRDALAAGIGWFVALTLDAFEVTGTALSIRPWMYVLLTILWIMLWLKEVQRRK